MNLVPGLGIVKGMGLTLRRFFEPKATIKYPEVRLDVPHKFRGRLQLLYDEWGTIKCETCFQCAQACPIECIDMGGIDTKGRYHVHWGPPETYGERRDESALRRSGRPVPDAAYEHFEGIDPRPLEAILEEFDHDPKHMLQILEATQAAYGHLPVAALKLISHRTGAWYAMIYGTASYYRHLRFEPPSDDEQAAGAGGAPAGRDDLPGRPRGGTRGRRAPAAARPARQRGDAARGSAAGPRPEPMTTILRTPAGWPSLLLGADAADRARPGTTPPRRSTRPSPAARSRG